MAAAAPVISAIAGSTAAKVGAGVVGGALLARQMVPTPPAAPSVAPAAVTPAQTAAPTPTPPAAPTATGPATSEEVAASPAVAAAEDTAKKGRAATIATAPGGILGTEGTRARRSLAGGGLIR